MAKFCIPIPFQNGRFFWPLAKRATRSFMSRASDLRENLYFAHPSQKMLAINLYCCDGYGSMIWDLSSKATEQFFKSWNKQARLSWNVHRQTHTFSLIVSYGLHTSFINLLVQKNKNIHANPMKSLRFGLCHAFTPRP